MASRPLDEEGRQVSTTLYLRGVPVELAREAKALAARRGITLTSLVIEALSRATAPSSSRGGDLPDELHADAVWYEEQRAELARQYSGQYLAVLDRQVFDHDVDFEALARRVFSRVGLRPVLMPKCLPGERVVRAPSPLVVRDQSSGADRS